MSKSALIKTEIVSPDTVALETRRDRILNYHTSVIRAFGQQMGYAFLCGLELNAAKEEIAHGAFEKWREQNLPELPKRTACRYSAFADALQDQCKSISKLTQRAQLLLTNGDFEDADRTELLQAVHDATDGKSLTQLYRDLGVIRDPVAQKDRNNQRKQTAEEIAQQENDKAQAFRIALNGDLQNAATNHPYHTRWSVVDLKESLDYALTFTSALREILKARGKSKPAKKKGRK